jgi:RNA recognition motif-containing protein
MSMNRDNFRANQPPSKVWAISGRGRARGQGARRGARGLQQRGRALLQQARPANARPPLCLAAPRPAAAVRMLCCDRPHPLPRLPLHHPPQVLHVRNLPPDATEEDVLELCRPFGRIVRIKLTGTAHNYQVTGAGGCRRRR